MKSTGNLPNLLGVFPVRFKEEMTMKNFTVRKFFTLLFVSSAFLAVPSYLLPQEIDPSSGLREIKAGCYVYLHRDDSPGVSSTFNIATLGSILLPPFLRYLKSRRT